MATEDTWSELYPELLKKILQCLSFRDAVRFADVCVSWHQAVDTSRIFSRPILLEIPDRIFVLVRSLTEDKASHNAANTVDSIRKQFPCGSYVGSSKEMLVIHMSETKLVLSDLFTGENFHLPPLTTLDSYQKNSLFYIRKAVVLVSSKKTKKKEREDLYGNPNIILVIIHSCSTHRSIAYGHTGSWMPLDESQFYEDIVAWKRRLFALTWQGASVEAWDFDRISFGEKPTKVMSFVPSRELPARPYLGPYLRPMERRYLVNSTGEILLVRRFFVSIAPREGKKPPTGPYRTEEFQVYKSCLGRGERWERMETLGEERVLFLGKNESALISSRDLPAGCEDNSIYFTDDHPTGMMYDTSDTGVYSLKHKMITSVCLCDVGFSAKN